METVLRQAFRRNFAENSFAGNIIFKVTRVVPDKKKWIGNFLFTRNFPLDRLVFKDYFWYDREVVRFSSDDTIPRPTWRGIPMFLAGKITRSISWYFASARKKTRSVLLLPDHVRYAQIGEHFPEKPILAVIRDPFSWYSSLFHYQVEHKTWYQHKNDPQAEALIESCHNIDDYVHRVSIQLFNRRYAMFMDHYAYSGQRDMPWVNLNPYTRKARHEFLFGYHQLRAERQGRNEQRYPQVQHFGQMTGYFITQFFKRPWEVLALPPDEFADLWNSGRWKEALPDVKFLEQVNLGSQLKDYLREIDYGPAVLREIDKMSAPINTSSGSRKSLEETYTKRDVVEKIREMEKPMFIMFPQYEELYKRLLKSAKE